MDHKVAAYGLTEEQVSHLEAALLEGYEVTLVECVTDLIVTNSVCSIVDTEKLDNLAMRTLIAYYMDVGDCLDETVIWLGEADVPELPSFIRCDSFLALLTELDSIMEQAKSRYETMQMYSSEYAFLPKHAIADSLEADIYEALHRKYGDNPGPSILKCVRQEWTALLEVDAVSDLAAAYEFACWLKANHHPFWISGPATSGLIPYLLGLTQTNPLPPHLYCPKCRRVVWKLEYQDGLEIPGAACEADGTAMIPDGHDLVWQEFCGYGRMPQYVFHLPEDIEGEVQAWLDHHWLKKLKPSEWMQAQPYEDHLVRGNMHFYFGGEQAAVTEIPKLCREDIFHYLKKHGFVDKDAFRGMNRVRKGRGLPVITEEMRTAGDSWIIERCKNIQSLPSKADWLEQMLFRVNCK